MHLLTTDEASATQIRLHALENIHHIYSRNKSCIIPLMIEFIQLFVAHTSLYVSKDTNWTDTQKKHVMNLTRWLFLYHIPLCLRLFFISYRYKLFRNISSDMNIEYYQHVENIHHRLLKYSRGIELSHFIIAIQGVYRIGQFPTCQEIVPRMYYSVIFLLSVYVIYHILPNFLLILVIFCFLPRILSYLGNREESRQGIPEEDFPNMIEDGIIQREYLTPERVGQITPECSICIDNFESGQTVWILRCHHVYHETCLQPWLRLRSTCPMCRENIIQHPP